LGAEWLQIFKLVLNNDITLDEYDKSQKQLNINDKNLFSSLKTKINAYLEALQTENTLIKKEIKNMHSLVQNISLNTILYGPPGTGKTFSTINETIKIIDSNFYESNKTDRVELKNKFLQLQEEGQIQFVTFHQSYSYEDFVEGIKAKINKSQEVVYEVGDGIFKKIANKAKHETTLTIDIDNINFSDFLNVGQVFEMPNGKKITIKNIDKNLEYIQDDTKHQLIREILIENLKNKPLMQKNEFLSSQIFIAQKVYEAIETKQDPKSKNYVLIIDEINRGNISKIFGELITLIEESKRLNSDESVKITLPYSGEVFGVPNNLYIIGTMNTADRSIALMDTALRRRFEFREMMPQTQLLIDTKIKGINIGKLLTCINQRVDYLYDRDHTIGHAYFMQLRGMNENEAIIELEQIFKNKIIPLLQEYFYDDWEKIQIVLGDHPRQGADDNNKFILEELQEEKSILGFDHDDIESEQYNYIINNTFTIEAYMKLSK